MSNNDKFIGHSDDPLLSGVDIENAEIAKQYAKLTEREKLLVFCKIHGYSMIPPSIERLYSDEFFLGGEEFFDGGRLLFDFWKSALPKIYPNEVTTAKPYILASGAIGIGSLKKNCRLE